MVEIRRVELSAAERLVALVRRFHGESGHRIDVAQAEAIRRVIADPRLGRAFIAVDGDQDCGYGLAFFRHSLDHAGTIAFLDDLYVVPERRRSGLGLRLMAAIEHDLSALGVRQVELHYDPGDTRASAFYARCGYRRSRLAAAEKPLAARPSR